jgi:HlyD family secretion protein
VSGAPPGLFRQAALEKLASPEQLDELVTVADTRGWLAAAGLGIVLATFIAWSLFGTIRTEVAASGILVRESGQVVSAVAPAAGMVERLLVHPGDKVVRGQQVALLNQDQVALQLANARAAAAELRAELQQRDAAVAEETRAMQRNAEERRSTYNEVIRLTADRLARLHAQLTSRESLRRAGLVSDDTIEQVRVNIAQCEEDIDSTRARLAELDTERLQYESAAGRDHSAAQRAVADADRQVAELALTLKTSRAVLAPAGGRVTELAVAEGQRLAADALVLNLETEGHRLQAVVYVPTAQGKRVTPGMAVRVAPATVRREEFGTMRGTVQNVSPFPSTPQGMLAVLRNQSLVNDFAAAGAPYETRIDLNEAATPTGYEWTSGTGPALDLTSGTTVEVWITVRRDAPIDLILPFVRHLAGGAA